MTNTRKLAEELKAKTGMGLFAIHRAAWEMIEMGLFQNLEQALTFMIEVGE